MGRAEPQLSPEMDLQICNFKMKLAVQMKPDLKWKHYDVPVAKFCNIRQSLRTNMEKREWCRRPRLLYNGTDVPLAWKGGQPCFPLVPLTKRRRGVCLTELAESTSSAYPSQAKEMYVPTRCPHSLTTLAIRDSRSCPPCHCSLVLWTFLAPVVKDAWDGPVRCTGPLIHSGDSCHMICIASLVSLQMGPAAYGDYCLFVFWKGTKSTCLYGLCVKKKWFFSFCGNENLYTFA